MAREIEMIRNGGGLIDVTLCDGFLYCASVFSKSIAKATFSFPYVLDPAFGALYHVHDIVYSLNNLELIPLELINSNRDAIRKAREAFLIYKGKTLEPSGMNRRDEI